MDGYFIKLKQITYNNTVTRDLTERVAALDVLRSRSSVYYPLEIPEGMRPDQIAAKYYADPTRDWVLYLTNNIIDPYYGWYLSTDEFINYLVQKYGSVEYAQQLVCVYRTNWLTDESILTVSYYDAIADSLRKYYVPIFGEGPTILGYQRRPVDWFVSTNRIISCNVASSVTFSNNDILDSVSGGSTVGTCQVSYSNTSTVIVQHVQGVVNSTCKFVSTSNSAANSTLTSATVLTENIPLSEEVFFEPVTYYQAEYELNQSKKFIDVLGDAEVLQFTETVRQQLAQ